MDSHGAGAAPLDNLETQAVPSTRRKLIPIDQCQETYDSCQEALEKVLAVDLTNFQSHADDLKKFHRSVKNAANDFSKVSQTYSSRLLKVARVAESQKVRKLRTQLLKDVEEVLTSINLLLSQLGLEEMTISKFDRESITSRLSLSSQLSSEQKSSPFTSPTTSKKVQFFDALQFPLNPSTTEISSANLAIPHSLSTSAQCAGPSQVTTFSSFVSSSVPTFSSYVQSSTSPAVHTPASYTIPTSLSTICEAYSRPPLMTSSTYVQAQHGVPESFHQFPTRSHISQPPF